MLRIDRRYLEHFDYLLLLLILLVCGMALFNLYSACYPPKASGMSPYMKQLIFMGLGLLCCIALLCFDYQKFHLLSYPFYVSVVLLLVVTLFFGSSGGGAQRWINFGFFKLQPSEPAKLMLVVCLASYYSRKEQIEGYTLKQLDLETA